jgi:hypothetical protein
MLYETNPCEGYAFAGVIKNVKLGNMALSAEVYESKTESGRYAAFAVYYNLETGAVDASLLCVADSYGEAAESAKKAFSL